MHARRLRCWFGGTKFSDMLISQERLRCRGESLNILLLGGVEEDVGDLAFAERARLELLVVG
jgi:hypothetical protein